MSDMMTGVTPGMAMTATGKQASGLVVKVNAEALMTLLSRQQCPLVVSAKAGLFKPKYKYVTNYKGITFYAESEQALELPADAEVVGVDDFPL